ncbi:MAG: 6-bladed beta-propeller [Bacteroidales bacterium]
MKGTTSLLFLLALSFLFACEQKTMVRDYAPTFPVETIRVDLDYTPKDPANQQPLSRERIAHDFWVQLETSPECLIANVEQLQLCCNKIFVLDKNIANALFVFDMKGRFLYQAGRKGRGPGEYFEASQFSVDSLNRMVVLFDSQTRDFHRYRLSDGRYINTLPADKSYAVNSGIYFDSLSYALDQIYILPFKGKAQYHLNLIRGDSIVGFKRLQKGHFLPNKFPFTVSSGKIFYTPIRCDTIFEIDKNGIKRGIYIDFGKRALPLDYLKRGFSKESPAKLLKSGYAVNLRSVLETDRFFYCAFVCGPLQRDVFYDKITHVRHPHINFSGGQPNSFRATYGNYFVAPLVNIPYGSDTPDSVIRAIEARRSPEHRAIIQNAREGDNPALYFVEIKPADSTGYESDIGR